MLWTNDFLVRSEFEMGPVHCTFFWLYIRYVLLLSPIHEYPHKLENREPKEPSDLHISRPLVCVLVVFNETPALLIFPRPSPDARGSRTWWFPWRSDLGWLSMKLSDLGVGIVHAMATNFGMIFIE